MKVYKALCSESHKLPRDLEYFWLTLMTMELFFLYFHYLRQPKASHQNVLAARSRYDDPILFAYWPILFYPFLSMWVITNFSPLIRNMVWQIGTELSKFFFLLLLACYIQWHLWWVFKYVVRHWSGQFYCTAQVVWKEKGETGETAGD